MTDWHFDEPLPINRPVLAWLAEELVGTKFHVAHNRRHGNGNGITTVATVFHWDAPRIIAWTELPKEPTDA